MLRRAPSCLLRSSSPALQDNNSVKNSNRCVRAGRLGCEHNTLLHVATHQLAHCSTSLYVPSDPPGMCIIIIAGAWRAGWARGEGGRCAGHGGEPAAHVHGGWPCHRPVHNLRLCTCSGAGPAGGAPPAALSVRPELLCVRQGAPTAVPDAPCKERVGKTAWRAVDTSIR